MNDRDEYYTSTTRKYLTYSNCANMTNSIQFDVLNIAFAVSRGLNRTLILLKFYVNGTLERSLLSVTALQTFDKSCSGQYRERSFLTHSLVPGKVKQPVLLIHMTMNILQTDLHSLVQKYSLVEEYLLKYDICDKIPNHGKW